MEIVLLTALGVGGASVFGALMGFLFKRTDHKFSDVILSFAAGVMLAAAVIGLILPSLEYGNSLALIVTVAGIFCGALCINLINKLVPHNGYGAVQLKSFCGRIQWKGGRLRLD